DCRMRDDPHPAADQRCASVPAPPSPKGRGYARTRRSKPRATLRLPWAIECCPFGARNELLPFAGGEHVAGGFHGDGVDGGAGGGVEGFEIFAAEGAVGGLLGEFDDAEQVALGIEDLDADGGGDVDVAFAVDGQTVAAAV